MVDHGADLCRIIPADAGSTWWLIIRVSTWKDHPRGCGEHAFLTIFSKSSKGSSPRMRGAHANTIAGINAHGIIPADAGSTAAVDKIQRAQKDHPRGCGEHT